MTVNNSDATSPVVGEEQLTHYLVNFVGRGEPVEMSKIALELGKGLAAAGVDLLMATSYSSQLGADPYKLGLPDIWAQITGPERQWFSRQWPELTLALDLLSDRGVSTP